LIDRQTDRPIDAFGALQHIDAKALSHLLLLFPDQRPSAFVCGHISVEVKN
jgi:hypothetical protein